MLTILGSADKTKFSAYYASIKAQIEQELGEPWSCEGFESFFLPKQKLVSLQLKGIEQRAIDPQADNVIIIMLTHSGDFLINGAPLKDLSKLRAGLELRIADRPINNLDFMLYFDEGSKGEWISKILGTLTEMGISSVSLIDP